MPRPYPPEFREKAVELARERAKPIAQIASDLGISESCLRRWMDQADINDGAKPGLTTTEREELVRLRRENRVLRMEKEILGKPRPSSPPRTAIDRADVPVRRGGEGPLPDHRAVPDTGRVCLGVPRVAVSPEPPGPSSGRRRCPGGEDPRDPPGLPPLLWQPARSPRAPPRRRDPLFPQAGRAADARAWDRRDPQAPQGLHESRPRRRAGWGPRAATVRRARSGPAVGL
jgi:transposase